MAPSRISGGYFITRRVERQPGMDAALPASLVTLSGCLAPFIPDSWSYSWSNDSTDQRAAARARFSLDEPTAAAASAWADNAINTDAVGWPSVFPSASDALRFRAEFLPTVKDALVVGISLDPQRVAEFLSRTLSDGCDPGGVHRALERRAQPETGGRFLGFDVLGWDCWPFHSYLCNGLEKEFASRFDARPNADGLYDDAVVASKCAAWACDERSHAEPVLWLAWAVEVYG